MFRLLLIKASRTSSATPTAGVPAGTTSSPLCAASREVVARPPIPISVFWSAGSDREVVLRQSVGVRIRNRHGGAQERSVPSRNGSVTEAPGGRHNIQAGATLDAAADTAAGDPGREDEAPVCIAAVAPDKLDTEFDVDADPDVPATSGAVVAVCATAGAVSAIGNDNTIQNRVAGDSLPVRRDVHRRRLPDLAQNDKTNRNISIFRNLYTSLKPNRKGQRISGAPCLISNSAWCASGGRKVQLPAGWRNRQRRPHEIAAAFL